MSSESLYDFMIWSLVVNYAVLLIWFLAFGLHAVSYARFMGAGLIFQTKRLMLSITAVWRFTRSSYFSLILPR